MESVAPHAAALCEPSSLTVPYSLCAVDPSEFQETQEVEGRMRFMDVEYDDKFDDKNSEEYLFFTGRFLEQVCLGTFLSIPLKGGFCDLTTADMITIIRFNDNYTGNTI